jgi:outer membrane protein assembly factor BamD (BamD/ComL family)
MSVTGISSSSFYGGQSIQDQMQQFQQEFNQLGQDLQSGDLTAAQSDFATVQSSSSQNSSPIAQAFSQLSQDLQSGNLTAAQQDYTTIQSDFQSRSSQIQSSQSQSTPSQFIQEHHHHHHSDGNDSSSSNEASAISQLFSELGSALQSANLSNAQQAYSTLQQDLQQYTQGRSSSASTSSQSGTGSFSVNG